MIAWILRALFAAALSAMLSVDCASAAPVP